MSFLLNSYIFESESSPVLGNWTPAELGATLLAWYKGDEISGSELDAIATWQDDSGNSNDATQATGANQPLLDVAAQNGLNVVDFGANDYIEVPNIYSGKTQGSIFLVVKMDVNDSGSNSLYSFGTVSTNGD